MSAQLQAALLVPAPTAVPFLGGSWAEPGSLLPVCWASPLTGDHTAAPAWTLSQLVSFSVSYTCALSLSFWVSDFLCLCLSLSVFL